MPLHDWSKIKDILAELYEYPHEKQLEMVRLRFADNPSLRDTIIKYLNAFDSHELPFKMRHLQLGAIVHNNYKIVSDGPVGKGGMGEVYIAEDLRSLNRYVALKRLTLEGPLALAIFENEARMLAKLIHPSIPSIRDYFRLGSDSACLVMEYVEGPDLSEYVQAGDDFLSIERCLSIAASLLQTLVYLHSVKYKPIDDPEAEPRFVIHQDIKPANIKLVGEHLYLLDFGIARTVPVLGTATVQVYAACTPNYASLQQINGENPTVQFDLFGVGATLYALLLGAPPIDAKTRHASAKHGDPLRPVHEVRGDVPEALSRLIQSAISLDPAEQPASAADMLDEVRRIQATLTTPPPTRRTQERPWIPTVVKRAVVLTALGLLVFVAALKGREMFRSSPETANAGADTTATVSDTKRPDVDSPAPIQTDSTPNLDTTPPVTEKAPLPERIVSSAERLSSVRFRPATLQVRDLGKSAQATGGTVVIDSITHNAQDDVNLDIGAHTMSASRQLKPARQLTVSYRHVVDGIFKDEPYLADSLGTFHVRIEPYMDSLTLKFEIAR